MLLKIQIQMIQRQGSTQKRGGFRFGPASTIPVIEIVGKEPLSLIKVIVLEISAIG